MSSRFSTPPGSPAAFPSTGRQRSGFDDGRWIKDWHMRQGPTLYATDVDVVMCESYDETPVALLEYKHFKPRPLAETGALLQFRNLADMAQLPGFIVFYTHEPYFWVRSWNFIAQQREGQRDRAMDERDFAEWLYHLRGRKLPACWPNFR